MYDQPAIEKSRELIWRRFTDPFQILGWDMPSWFWGVVLGVVLVAAFFYVAWMYVKDSRGVGPWWATFLGLLRSAVYVILALVFLLPAWQEVEVSTNKSKVLILFDPTTSMTDTRDDLPEPGKKFEELLTRQEKVLAFLKQKEFGFIKELVEKNPVTAYRFGGRIDENFVLLTPDGEWTRDEWEERAQRARSDQAAPGRGVVARLLVGLAAAQSADRVEGRGRRRGQAEEPAGQAGGAQRQAR